MPRAVGALLCVVGLLSADRAFGASGGAAAIAQAEALAAEAEKLIPTQPKEAVARARQALALTSEFDPIVFVKAGRKGEVVEDEFVAARNDYRRHRARLYAAVGEALVAAGSPLAASRYLRRAALLDPATPRYLALARVLLDPRPRGGGGGRARAHRGPRRFSPGSASAGGPGGRRRGLAQRPGRDRPGPTEGAVGGDRRVA